MQGRLGWSSFHDIELLAMWQRPMQFLGGQALPFRCLSCGPERPHCLFQRVSHLNKTRTDLKIRQSDPTVDKSKMGPPPRAGPLPRPTRSISPSHSAAVRPQKLGDRSGPIGTAVLVSPRRINAIFPSEPGMNGMIFLLTATVGHARSRVY